MIACSFRACGVELASGTVPQDPAKQVDLALDGMKAVLEAAGLRLSRHMVFVNPYLTRNIPSNTMNKLYANRLRIRQHARAGDDLRFESSRRRRIEFTGVAVRDLSQRRAVRPKNMAPSATASPAVFAGDTLFCSAKSGFIPGINQGVFGMSVEHQLRQTMRNLLDNLEEADMTLDQVVATNVYLDNIDQFAAMNKSYALLQHPLSARPPDPAGRAHRSQDRGRGAVPDARTDFTDRRKERAARVGGCEAAIDLEPFLSGGVGLVPLAPLTNLPEAVLSRLVQRVVQRINREPRPLRDKLWTAGSS